MVSKRWQRHHTWMPVISILVLSAVTFSLALLRLPGWLSLLLTILTWIGGGAIFYFINKHVAKSVVRIFLYDVKEFAWLVQKVFKQQHIRYHRKIENDRYLYEFPGQQVTLTLEPYAVENWLLEGGIWQNQATKVAIHGLKTDNEEFVRSISNAIDAHMATIANDEAAAESFI